MQTAIAALTNGAIYSLLALSLVLIYRGSGVMNFGVGYMAIVSGILFVQLPLGVWGALGVTIVASAVLGMLGYLLAVRIPESAGASHAMLAISTLGFGFVIEYIAGVAWGKQAYVAEPLWEGVFQVGNATISYQRVVAAILTMVCFVIVVWLLERTQIGWSLEAISFNRSTAAAYGINPFVTLLFVWALGGALAGIAGALLAGVSAVSAPLSLTLTLYGFAAAVVGGLRRVWGAVLGAFVVAAGHAILVSYVSTAYATATVFLLLFIVLALRPGGILGATRKEVRV